MEDRRKNCPICLQIRNKVTIFQPNTQHNSYDMKNRFYLLLAAAFPLMAWGQTNYAINFAEDATISRNDRFVLSVALTGNQGSSKTLSVDNTTHYAFQKLFDGFMTARPGETLAPNVGYTGTWMHSYVYIDFGKDGSFTPTINNDYTPADGSDLVTFSSYESHNSLGQSVNQGFAIQSPAFTLPDDMAPGIYRIRFKVDWDSLDPGGDTTQGLIKNGGGIIDALLSVVGTSSNVTTQATHGEVTAADGTGFDGMKVPSCQPLDIHLQPEEGYVIDEVTILYGDMSGDSLVHETPQWISVSYPGFCIQDNKITLPATYTSCCDLKIIATFTEKPEEVPDGEDYGVNFPKDLTHDKGAEGRYISAITATSSRWGTVFLAEFENTPDDNPVPLYRDLTNHMFTAPREEPLSYKFLLTQPGETLTPQVTYGGDMHAYLYIDYNNDGMFSVALNADGSPKASSELVSYTYANGRNSMGKAVDTETPSMDPMPAFTLPSMLPTGVYRARLKIDWNNTDPRGQYGTIDEKGGAIVDFHVAIYPENPERYLKSHLTLDTRNGNIYSSEGSSVALPYIIIPGAVYSVVPTPVADGYELQGGVYIKQGLNLDGPQYIRGNRQWIEETIAPEDIPSTGLEVRAAGDVLIRAYYEPGTLPQYNLVFSDEFNAENGTKFDEEKWSSSPRQNAAWNRFLVDSIDVAYHENGNMVLKAIPNLDRSTDNAAMLTGGIQTSGKFSFTYGKVECRAKVNKHSGNFPAIWMMPQPPCAGWPNAGEIDIFEQINNEDRSYHTIHTNWTYNLGNKNNPQSSFNAGCAMDRYHTYGLEWDADQLRWFVDGKQVGSYNRVPANADKGQWPFDSDFYLILNQSVGNGSWASNPDETYTYRMDVDWIRVYQENTAYTGVSRTEAGQGLTIGAQPGALTLQSDGVQTVQVIDLSGRSLYNQTVKGRQVLPLKKGIYIVNRAKISIP